MNQIQANYLTAKTLSEALFLQLPEDDQTPEDAALFDAWLDAEELATEARRQLIEWGVGVGLKMAKIEEDLNALQILKRRALRGGPTGQKVAEYCMKLAA